MDFNNIKDKIKKPHNIILILILILALVIRLNYFNDNQAVWWDEAEYLLQAKHWAFQTPNTGFGEVRPILLSFILSLFYRIRGSELSARIVILLFSIFGVYLAYLVGKELFNKEVGLISSFLLSIFYLDIFYTIRVLVDVPGATMSLLMIYLFWKGYYQDKKYLYWFGFAFGLAFMLKFTTGLFLIVIFLYLLITEHLSFFKIKELYIAGIIAFITAMPYFIWSYLTYGDPIRGVIRSSGDGLKYSAQKGFEEAFGRFASYILQTNSHLKIVLFIILLIGLISFYKLIIGFDLVVRRKEKSLNPYLFLLIWILIPLVYFSFFFHVYDPRYLISIFPALFIIIGLGIMIVYNFLTQYEKRLAIALIILILLIAGYQQNIFTKQVIDSRSNSFVQFKYAGEWLKDKTEKDEIIFNTGVPQNVYYTERDTFGHGSEENFENRRENEKINYYVLSRLELAPDWAYTYPSRHPDIMKPVFACDNSLCTDDLSKIDNSSITLIVYQFV